MDLQTILRSIRRADIDYDLIADGDRIAVGVSGGKDSMVLLSALHMYSKFKVKFSGCRHSYKAWFSKHGFSRGRIVL